MNYREFRHFIPGDQMTPSPPVLSTMTRMPAEWERHLGTWLAWPHQRSDWPGRVAPIPWVYAEIVRALAPHEEVHLLIADADQGKAARRVLASSGVDLSGVHFHEFPTDRSWMRDSGPIFVNNPTGEKLVLDWQFNAWAKYSDWRNDDQIPGF